MERGAADTIDLMTSVAEVVDGLAERTRPETAASWDPVGLQLGDPGAEVISAAVCHEVTEAVVNALEKKPVDLVVTYHPLLFTPTNRLVAGRSAESRAFRMIGLGAAVLVAHTDFDAAPGGAADALAHELDLRFPKPFGGDPDQGLPDIGRVGALKATLAVLDARVSDAFGNAGLRLTGNGSRYLDKVTVIPGSGGDFIEAAAEVSDALVTGDVSHHRAVLAADLGLAIVDPGHIATERPGVRALVKMVAQVLGSKVTDLTRLDPQTWG